MTKEFWKAVAAGILRVLLGAAGGYLVKQGAVTGPQWEIIVGVLATLAVALVWSVIQKYHVDELVGTALRMPEGATREQLQQVREGAATVDVFRPGV